MNKRTIKSVWDQLIDDPAEALDLCIRSEIMMQLKDLMDKGEADLAHVDESDLAALQKGRIDLLDLASLVRLVAASRCDIKVEVAPKPSA
jgi:predicted XRE-type DNA-binding protein